MFITIAAFFYPKNYLTEKKQTSLQNELFLSLLRVYNLINWSNIKIHLTGQSTLTIE